jgi:hypothetical protein
MPFYRLAQDSVFEPSQLQAMGSAFDLICAELELADRPNDPLRTLVAEKIIELARAGESDSGRLHDFAMVAIKTLDRSRRESTWTRSQVS